jgi:hypothetical protein
MGTTYSVKDRILEDIKFYLAKGTYNKDSNALQSIVEALKKKLTLGELRTLMAILTCLPFKEPIKPGLKSYNAKYTRTYDFIVEAANEQEARAFSYELEFHLKDDLSTESWDIQEIK